MREIKDISSAREWSDRVVNKVIAAENKGQLCTEEKRKEFFEKLFNFTNQKGK